MSSENDDYIYPFEEHDQEFLLIHNYVFDVIMPRLKPNAWKVLCVIYRATRGWIDKGNGKRIRNVEMSYQDLMAASGIKSAVTLNACLQELINEDCITVYLPPQHSENGNDWSKSIYALNKALRVPKDGYKATARSDASKQIKGRIVRQKGEVKRQPGPTQRNKVVDGTIESVVDGTIESVVDGTIESVDNRNKEVERKGKKVGATAPTQPTLVGMEQDTSSDAAITSCDYPPEPSQNPSGKANQGRAGTRGKASKDKQPSKERDATLDHPASQIYRRVFRVNMNDVQRHQVCDLVGDSEDSIQVWDSACEAARYRGCNPTNVPMVVDYFKRRMTIKTVDQENSRSGNGNNHRSWDSGGSYSANHNGYSRATAVSPPVDNIQEDEHGNLYRFTPGIGRIPL